MVEAEQAVRLLSLLERHPDGESYISFSSVVESHLQTQRSAVKMLHERILLLVKYVADVVAGTTKKDHDVLRSLAALVASLPASENKAFREEFDTVGVMKHPPQLY